jgi:cholesterol transport system auxiliary component
MPPAEAFLKRLLFAALFIAPLEGCGSNPRETFDLAGVSPLVEGRIASHKSQVRLAVNEPDAIPPANSDRIVIRTGPGEVANLAGAQWADRLPRLVQARLIEGFDHSRVTANVPGTTVDFSLATEIRRFEIDVAQQTAVVEIAARLIDDRSNRQRAARVFVGEAPAPHTTGPEATQSLREAMETTIRQIARWSAGNT